MPSAPIISSRLPHVFDTVYNGEKVPPRGFTPFQFSSKKLQMSTTQLGGLIPNNPISSMLSDATSWYEMWINPEKVNLNRQFQIKEQHTAGSIVAFHYRPHTLKMSVSGVVGWIGLNPQQEDTSLYSGIKKLVNKGKNQNSPRVFLSRLRTMAEDPAYFIGTDGVEHYNIKYIKIYTKQYPYGVLCEGYYTKFEVPESGEDVQTVEYSFDFTIENLTPITALQKVAGMFGGTTGNAVGSLIRTVPGLA
jgi:hypothetical protein